METRRCGHVMRVTRTLDGWGWRWFPRVQYANWKGSCHGGVSWLSTLQYYALPPFSRSAIAAVRSVWQGPRPQIPGVVERGYADSVSTVLLAADVILRTLESDAVPARDHPRGPGRVPGWCTVLRVLRAAY